MATAPKSPGEPSPKPEPAGPDLYGPGGFRRALFNLAATKHPPAGAGLVALAGWTLWVAHLVSPRLRDWFHGAAGLFVVIAIMYNHAVAEGRRNIERRHASRTRKDHAGRNE